MIVLSQVTDKIQVVLNAAHTSVALHCYASWRDRTSTTFIAGRTPLATNGATPIDLVGSPAASTERIIDSISVFNSDTGSKIVTVLFDANGTDSILYQVTLAVGEKLEYAEGGGWIVYTTSGAVKQSINQGNSPVSSAINQIVLGANITNNNGVANTIQDVTALSFPVVSGSRYKFKFVIQYTAAATTTGSRWTINGPTTSELRFRSEYSLTTTTRTFNDGLSVYDTPAASNASSAATGSNIAIIQGFIVPTANGNVVARFASEVLSSAIVALTGSYVEYQQI